MNTVNDAFATTAETKSWVIKSQLSSGSAEPGKKLWISFLITVKRQSYDFELWVRVGQPLSVDRDGHIRMPSLSSGEIRLENFTIFVPTTVSEGETYAVNFRAQSYASPAPLWGRIGQSPDDSIDTTRDPVSRDNIVIVTRPALTISTLTVSPSSPEAGQAFEVTATIQNVGTGTLRGVNLMLNLDSGLSLLEGSHQKSIGDLAAGQSQTVTWKVASKEPGTYVLIVQAKATNHPEIVASQKVTTDRPWWQRQENTISLLFIAFVVIIVILLLHSQFS